MTVAENRERGHNVETAACDRWPLERVADDRAEWYDLEFVADVVDELAGTIATVGDVVEAKSCYATYDGRAGRWWIRRENHERLVDDGGWYVLVVLERDDLTYEQRTEIAETLSTRATTFEAEQSGDVDRD
ncbi:hypothetical protein Htur_1949 [Haloterrigena turkmenica DSM 5511]|uniref:Uncharacterized protein n=1 Tax=Haloterrigena turkmenica (strain ATCC 51198 / DSM 5511 / JCM 9101 / NCIMB 13204 / VKM B-1734 / 4k) TaxID=543526 RepID=D2RSQ8_HALTV|nr:hypothetical protein [Haloterrigena turkmenica]ADB60834.1 hypothetical protein Htur_1949 [Haloterrigena turkmenica DSM 5511]